MESTYFRSTYWDDNFIDGLTVQESYLYLYLITNRYTKPSGIYKLNLQECLIKTKLKNKEQLFQILSNSLKSKVFMFNEWVFICNFLRKSFNLPISILSKTIKQSIEKQFIQECVPVELIACFSFTYDTPPYTLSIPYPYPMDTIAQYIKSLGLRFKEGDLKSKSKHSVKGGKKPPPSTSGDSTKFIDFAFQTFKKQFGLPLKIQGAKDGKLIKDLLGTYKLETLQELWMRFLDSTDEFILKAGKSIGIFSSQINKLISGVNLTKAEIRSLKNWQAGEEAERMINEQTD